MAKRPSFQFYPSDWIADRKVFTMTPAQKGGYIMLLCFMWDDEACRLPNDLDELMILSGLDSTGVERLLKCFINEGSTITHKRLLEEREKQDKFRKYASIAGKKSAEIRQKQDSQESFNDRSTTVQRKGNSSSSSSKSFNKLKDESRQKKEKVIKEFPEEVLQLSREFFLAVRSWLPEFQKKVETEEQITNLLTSSNWALEISRAISIDMRTSEQIRFMVHYVHGGEVGGRILPVHNFWSKNILSPKKLREKFDQLAADARSKLSNKKNSVAQL